MKRRSKLTFLIVLTMVLLLTGSAISAEWPTRPPVVTIGYSAGGGTDTAIRPVVALMEKYLGVPINVVNMPGAASAVAANHVLNAKQDGYTILGTASGPFSGFRVLDRVDTDWTDWYSFHPFVGPAALITRPNSGLKDFDDVIEYIAEKAADFGMSGFGTGPHVLAEQVFALADREVKPNYVTYNSCHDVAIGVISGEIEFGMVTFGSVLDFARSGHIDPLFIISEEDFQLDSGKVVPSVLKFRPEATHLPQLSESWPIMLSKDVPVEVYDKVMEAFKWAMNHPNIKEFAENQVFKIVGYYGEAGDRFLSLSEAGYAWALYNAGIAQISPEKFGIPTVEEWDWEIEKQKLDQ